ncbi:MAG TPA: endonuclease III domain-containing protein, partial [Thermoplasmatales archaeon]|nr:endonuclease III domain-containing protein [Thermoplasmatales archaeon]
MQKPLIDRKNRIMTIYERLLDAFGEQGWWPLTPEGEIKPVHNGDAPRNERDRFEVIVGAILTQNTSWRNVERAIESLNKKNLLD